MKLESAYFDKVRMGRRAADAPELRATPRLCDTPGCEEPGEFRAPKGRRAEGEYFRFCLDHVREYNKRYNYFAGMSEAAVQSWMKDSLTGHRPTWKTSVNAGVGETRERFGPGARASDPFNVFEGKGGAKKPGAEPKRVLQNQERKALDTLGLPDNATPAEIKARYHLLAKRFHPDANGGDRGHEDRLRDVIQAYNYLKGLRAA